MACSERCAPSDNESFVRWAERASAFVARDCTAGVLRDAFSSTRFSDLCGSADNTEETGAEAGHVLDLTSHAILDFGFQDTSTGTLWRRVHVSNHVVAMALRTHFAAMYLRLRSAGVGELPSLVRHTVNDVSVYEGTLVDTSIFAWCDDFALQVALRSRRDAKRLTSRLRGLTNWADVADAEEKHRRAIFSRLSDSEVRA
jgi:hypothetical protein